MSKSHFRALKRGKHIKPPPEKTNNKHKDQTSQTQTQKKHMPSS